MKRSRQLTFLTGLTTVALVGAIPLLAAGTASAQSGSRLCGQSYDREVEKTPGAGEKVTEYLYELYEVDVFWGDSPCDEATSGPSDPTTAGFADNWTYTGSVHKLECEDLEGAGGHDVCNQMNRSDTRFEMNRYWVRIDKDGKVEVFQG